STAYADASDVDVGVESGAAHDAAPVDAAAADSGADDGVSDAAVMDEPCPAGPIQVNCSTSCGGPTESCSHVTCGRLDWLVLANGSLPFVMRTPSVPGIDPACVARYAPSDLVYRMELAFNFNAPLQHRLRVRVAPPWQVTVETSGPLS